MQFHAAPLSRRNEPVGDGVDAEEFDEAGKVLEAIVGGTERLHEHDGVF